MRYNSGVWFSQKKFIRFNYNELNYVCCKDTIHFLYEIYPKAYKIAMEDCPNEYADMTSINCLDLFVYGFEDVCSRCENILLTFFLRFFKKVEK